jgi:hypothetical protein
MRKIILVQFIVLLLGTVFAWANFGLELNSWLQEKECATGCFVGQGTQNPFLSACFFGAIFFTIAFILSILILKKKP